MKLHPLLLSLAASAYSKDNPESSFAAQKALLNTKNKYILIALSLNPNLHDDIFYQLLQNPSKKILNNLLSQKLPEDRIQAVLKLELGDAQQSILISSNNMTEEHINLLKDGPKTSSSILENQELSYELRRKHLPFGSLKSQLIFIGDYPDRFSITEISDLLLISDSLPPKNYPRLPLARVIHKKPEILDQITSYHPEPVITTASSSPYLTTLPRQKNLLGIIIENSYQYAFMALSANPRFQHQLLDDLTEKEKNTPLLLNNRSRKSKLTLNLLTENYSELTDKKTLSYLLKRALPGEYSVTGKIIDALLLASNPLTKEEIAPHLHNLAATYPYLTTEIIEILGPNQNQSQDQSDTDDQKDKEGYYPHNTLLNTNINLVKDLLHSDSEIIINSLGSNLSHWENFIALLPDFQMDVTSLIETSKKL